MGSVFEYISIEKAAEALNLTRRQVYNYIKSGRLRTVKDGKKQLVRREDITRILEEKKGQAPPIAMNKKTLRRMEARVHMLEKQVRLLMRMQNLYHDPLRLSAMELKGFHEMADYCLKESWSPQQEEMWKDFFLRIQLEDLESLHSVLPNEQPWLVFHTLCKAIMEAPHDNDLKLQFKAGKVHLEKIAYVWAVSNRQPAKELDKVIESDQKRVNKLARRVKARRAKK